MKATCPKAIEVKVDATFRCQVTFDNGESFTVDGTVTSKHGTNFEYKVPINEPNFIAAKLEKNLAEELAKQAAAPQSVTCGPPGIHRPPADHKLGCDVVNASGAPAKLVVTFDAAGIAQGWEIVE